MPIIQEKPKVAVTDVENDPGLEYLESQRWWNHRTPPDISRVAEFYKNEALAPETIERVKRYEFSERVTLAPNFENLNRPFLDLLASRATDRTAGRSALSLEEISTLLCASYGTQSKLPRASNRLSQARTVPTPGGLCSNEIYYLSINTSSLPNGIYHFRPDLFQFERLNWNYNESEALALVPDALVTEQFTKTSGVILVTAVFDRLRKKYGNRYLRFALLEAGCICQNLDLVSHALDIKLWHQGSVDEHTSRKILHVDGVREAVVHSAVVLFK